MDFSQNQAKYFALSIVIPFNSKHLYLILISELTRVKPGFIVLLVVGDITIASHCPHHLHLNFSGIRGIFVPTSIA